MRLRRVLLGLLFIVLVAVLGAAALVGYDSQLGAQAADVSNVTFPAADGTELVGYLATPESIPPGVDGYPAVIMVHEWWGLTAEIREMADLLSEQGYVVLAPDTYRGAVAATVPGAIFLRVTVPKARVDSDMQAAYSFLAAQDTVDPARIAVMGFCYGGGVALRHALENADLAAVINLYGDTVSDPAAFGALLDGNTPLLGIFGAEDQQIPVAEVEAFRTALDEAAVESTVTIYSGVGHAFVYPESLQEGGAARDAWTQILTFLAETLTVPALPPEA